MSDSTDFQLNVLSAQEITDLLRDISETVAMILGIEPSGDVEYQSDVWQAWMLTEPDLSEQVEQGMVVIRQCLVQLFLSKQFHAGIENYLDELKEILGSLSWEMVHTIVRDIFDNSPEGKSLQEFDPGLRSAIEKYLIPEITME